MKFKNWMVLIVSVVLLIALSACGQGDEKTSGDAGKKKLVMGTSADYKPFEFVETEGSKDYVGFDIDLTKYIAKELGYELEVKDIDFANLITALDTGKVDFVAAAMNPTEDRKKNVDFTEVYYTANHMLVYKKEAKIETVEALKGKKVGVQLGSTQEEKANELKESTDFAIETRNRIPEIVQELLIGRVDAAIIEDTVAKNYLDKNKDLTGFTIDSGDENGYAIALPKNSDLVDDFNKVIQKMKENGELDKIIKKWFDSEQ